MRSMAASSPRAIDTPVASANAGLDDLVHHAHEVRAWTSEDLPMEGTVPNPSAAAFHCLASLLPKTVGLRAALPNITW